MQDFPQLSLASKAAQKGPDTSQKMFGILDELAGTFKNALEEAQGAQNASEQAEAAKKAKVGNKAIEEPGEAPENVEPEATVEAEAPKEAPKEEVASEVDSPDSLLIDESSELTLLDEKAAREEPEAVEIEEEAIEPDEAIALPEPVAEEELSAQEALPQDPLASQEIPEEAVSIEQDAAPLSEEPAPILSNEAEVDEEVELAAPNEEPIGQEAVKEEQAAIAPQEAEAAPIAQALEPKAEQVPNSEKTQAPEEAPLASKAKPLPMAQPEQPQTFQGEKPSVEVKAAEVKPAPEAQFLAEDGDAPAEEASTEEFHSIKTPKKSEGLVQTLIDKGEAKKVMAGLEQVANQTSPQAPAPERISAKVVEGLKSVNPSMAKGLEAARSSAASKAVASAPAAALPRPQGSSQSTPFTAKDSAKADIRKDLPTRLDELKSKVMEQVRFKIKMEMRKHGGEVRLQLQPRFLGTVKVKLSLEDTKMRASFIVDNQSAKEMLQRSSSDLQNALLSQGVEVDEIEVNVADHGLDGDESGKAFASIEDQKARKEWIGSFYRFGEEAAAVGPKEEIQSEEEHSSSDEGLDVVV